MRKTFTRPTSGGLLLSVSLIPLLGLMLLTGCAQEYGPHPSDMSDAGLTDVAISNNGTTDVLGEVVVEGIIVEDTNVYIAAQWPDAGLTARVEITVLQQTSRDASQVFERHFETFQHPDVREHFPDVLRAFKDTEIPLPSIIFDRFIESPRFLLRFVPDADKSILVLLLVDNDFQALFRDEQFHAVVQSLNEIDRLIELIEWTRPIPPFSQPESPRGTTPNIVSGNHQSGKEPEPVVSLQPSTAEPPLPPMYWIEGNTIYYRPAGGGKDIFNKPQDGILTGGLAVDTVGSKVYWTKRTRNNTGRVQSADLDGNSVQTVKAIIAVPFDIAVGTDKKDKRWIYWTNAAKKIQRINVDGSDFQGTFMTFPNSPTSPNHIAFDQEEFRLYWTEEGRIRGVDANGIGKRDIIVVGCVDFYLFSERASGASSGVRASVSGCISESEPCCTLGWQKCVG